MNTNLFQDKDDRKQLGRMLAALPLPIRKAFLEWCGLYCAPPVIVTWEQGGSVEECLFYLYSMEVAYGVSLDTVGAILEEVLHRAKPLRMS